jgi:hypothetical protein
MRIGPGEDERRRQCRAQALRGAAIRPPAPRSWPMRPTGFALRRRSGTPHRPSASPPAPRAPAPPGRRTPPQPSSVSTARRRSGSPPTDSRSATTGPTCIRLSPCRRTKAFCAPMARMRLIDRAKPARKAAVMGLRNCAFRRNAEHRHGAPRRPVRFKVTRAGRETHANALPGPIPSLVSRDGARSFILARKLPPEASAFRGARCPGKPCPPLRPKAAPSPRRRSRNSP